MDADSSGVETLLAVVAKHRALESGDGCMVQQSRRCAPGGELPSRHTEILFDDDHGMWNILDSGTGAGG